MIRPLEAARRPALQPLVLHLYFYEGERHGLF